MSPKLPKPIHHGRSSGKGKKDPIENDSNNDDESTNITSSRIRSIHKRWSFLPCLEQPSFASAALLSGFPDIAKLCLRSLAITTVTLYVLNQKHMLPKPIGRVVSRVLFWPTIPITTSRRIGKWTTEVDNTVIIGGAPFGFMKYPEKLARKFNVRGVVNMCEEYRGPVSSYKRLGIEQLRLPTVDHFEPSVEDLKRAVDFIQNIESKGGRVYVHCRAGHGRSAAAVYAWLLYKEPLADPIDLNEKLCAMRNVRKGLWKQPNINAFRIWLQSGGMADDTDTDMMNYKTASTSRKRRSTSSNSNQQTISDIEHFGQVFSDEDAFSTDYDSDWDRPIYDYSDDMSEDERDYEMWRNYNGRYNREL